MSLLEETECNEHENGAGYNPKLLLEKQVYGNSAHTWWFNRLGVGVWIVLGIIILVIAIIVGYCIYQKKCGKSEEYQQPNEQKQAEQQQNPVWF